MATNMSEVIIVPLGGVELPQVLPAVGDNNLLGARLRSKASRRLGVDSAPACGVDRTQQLLGLAINGGYVDGLDACLLEGAQPLLGRVLGAGQNGSAAVDDLYLVACHVNGGHWRRW